MDQKCHLLYNVVRNVCQRLSNCFLYIGLRVEGNLECQNYRGISVLFMYYKISLYAGKTSTRVGFDLSNQPSKSSDRILTIKKVLVKRQNTLNIDDSYIFVNCRQ